MTPTLSTLIGTKKTEREGLKQEMPRKDYGDSKRSVDAKNLGEEKDEWVEQREI